MQVGWPQEPISKDEFRMLPPLARHCLIYLAHKSQPAADIDHCRNCGRDIIQGSNRLCWECRKNPNPRPPALHTVIEPMFSSGEPVTIQSVVEAMPGVKQSTITKAIQHLARIGRLELVERGSYRRPSYLAP